MIGVAVEDWTVDRLREHARRAIEATGEHVDDDVFARFAGRLGYVSGDFGDEQRTDASPRRSRTAEARRTTSRSRHPYSDA